MRTVLITLGVLVFLVLLGAAVVLFRLSRGPIALSMPTGPELRARQVAGDGKSIVVALSFEGSRSATVTDLEIRRDAAARLGLSAPTNFVERPLELEPEDRKDPATVAWIDKRNAEELRWEGKLVVPPAGTVMLSIPATRPEATEAELSIGYEVKFDIGGKLAASKVTVGRPAPSD